MSAFLLFLLKLHYLYHELCYLATKLGNENILSALLNYKSEQLTIFITEDSYDLIIPKL